jgi:hypothetical protein
MNHVCVQVQHMRDDDVQGRNLHQHQIDEFDISVEYFPSQRYMVDKTMQAATNAGASQHSDEVHVHCMAFNSNSMISLNMPCRFRVLSEPPAV